MVVKAHLVRTNALDLWMVEMHPDVWQGIENTWIETQMTAFSVM
jgi:hypothetical protein